MTCEKCAGSIGTVLVSFRFQLRNMDYAGARDLAEEAAAHMSPLKPNQMYVAAAGDAERVIDFFEGHTDLVTDLAEDQS